MRIIVHWFVAQKGIFILFNFMIMQELTDFVTFPMISYLKGKR